MNRITTLPIISFLIFREILFLNGLRAVVAQHYSGEKMPESHIPIEYGQRRMFNFIRKCPMPSLDFLPLWKSDFFG
jgi:hypothetical protein